MKGGISHGPREWEDPQAEVGRTTEEIPVDMAYIRGYSRTKAGTGVQTGKKSSGQTEKDRAASKSAAAP